MQDMGHSKRKIARTKTTIMIRAEPTARKIAGREPHWNCRNKDRSKSYKTETTTENCMSEKTTRPGLNHVVPQRTGVLDSVIRAN